MINIDIKLLDHQWRFIHSVAPTLWLCGGIGSGKSFTLALYGIIRAISNPETIGMFAACSYRQLNDSILREFFDLCQQYSIPYKYNQLLGYITLFNGAKIKTASLENPTTLRGVEIGWLGIDEGPFATKDAFNVAIGRVRCKKSKALQTRMVGSPNGFNWTYELFAGTSKRSTVEMIKATAWDNYHLSTQYRDSLKDLYDPLTYRQEVLGEFVAAQEGRVYYKFDRDKHVRETPSWASRTPIIVGGCDFNVNPGTGVIAAIHNGRMHIKDEIWLTNSNTFELADEFSRRETMMTLVPDATGKNKKTSSSTTDHQILKDAGLPVVSKRFNPPKKDRYNATNKMLAEGRLTVSPKCVKLIEDLENFTYDNAHSDLSHMSDSATYPLWHYFPIKRSKPAPGIRSI